MEVASVVGWVVLGILLLVAVLDSALRTFILPRGVAPIITRLVFVGVRSGFNAWARATRSYEARDSVMALYGPVGLLVLPLVWLLMTLGAFTALFHALGVRGFERAFEMSGSSLFTSGIVHPPDLADHRARVRRSGQRADTPRAAHRVPSDDLRGVLATGGPGRTARGARR